MSINFSQYKKEIPFAKKKIFLSLSIICVYLLLIFIQYPGLFIDFSTKIPGGRHDDTAKILGIIQFLTDTNLSNIFHLPIFYPEAYTLARTHPLLGVSIFFKIFQIFGFNSEQSYNSYIILSLIIGAFGCYLLAGEFSKNKIFPFLFSTIYIIHQINILFFIWLNFLSFFYVPYIFYFFIRFFKTKKKLYILSATLFATMQILSSLYYGFILWVFLIPSFLFFCFVLKIISIKDIKHILIYLFLAFFVIVLILSPFSRITQKEIENRASFKSVRASDLFYDSKVPHYIFDAPIGKNMYFFPGYTFFLFILFFIVSFLDNKKVKIALLINLIVLSFAMTFFVYINLVVLDILFVVFLSLTLFIIIFSWKKMDKWMKLLVSTFSFYLFIVLHIPNLPLLNSITQFDFFSKWLPIEGFRAISRTFLIILPFFISIATIGASRYLKAFKNYDKKKKIIIVLFILVLMTGENIRHRRINDKMGILPEKNVEIYDKLPFKKNKILLEIPFYFKIKARNSCYMLNWKFHKNYLLNGSTSKPPRSFITDLRAIIGSEQKDFPTEIKLKRLIENYSVTHIIFHWDRLGTNQNDEQIRKRKLNVQRIKKYGKIIYSDEKHTILRTQEYIPTRRIIRTYSIFHLRKKDLEIILNKKYTGKILIKLNNRLVERREIESESFCISRNIGSLNVHGNRLEIIFSKPVLLKELELSE